MAAALGAGVLLEQALLCQEGLGVELAAPVHHRDVVLLVQHLVVDDPLDEVARHEGAVQRGVDADQAVLDRVGAHLDRKSVV